MNPKPRSERTKRQLGKPRTRRLPLQAGMAVKLFCLWALAEHVFVAACMGATVTWVGGSGDWGDARNWSGRAVPGQNDDVVVATSNEAITVTISSETVQVNSLSCEETLLLDGGTILGGTLTTDSGGVLVVRSGTLDGVTVNGVLDVGNTYSRAILTATNGLTLNGTMLVGNPTNGYEGVVWFGGNQVLSGDGTVTFGVGNYGTYGTYNQLSVTGAGQTLVIGPGITVQGENGTIGYDSTYGTPPLSNVTVVNQGVISPNVDGDTITVLGANLNNGGTLAAENGGTLQLSSGMMVNSGTIEASGGTVYLGSSLTTTDLGTVQSSEGGTVDLAGTLDNTNTTLVVNGSLELAGGTIAGGTAASINGGSLIVSSGTLDGVTMNGVLDVGNSVSGASLTVTNGLTLNGTMLVGNPTNYSCGSVSFSGSQVLGGNGAVVFGGYSDFAGFAPEWSYNALLVANPGTTLVISSGITVNGQAGWIGYNAIPQWEWESPRNPFRERGATDASVVNEGTISADVSGGPIAVGGGSLTSVGTLDAENGGTLQLSSGMMVNSGTIEASGGTVDLAGNFATQDLGTVQSTAGGTVNITGSVDNTNATLNGAAASLELYGGTIAGGTILTTNGGSLTVSSGTLDGVTLNGTLDVGNTVYGASLTVTNGFTLNGTMLVGNPSDNTRYGDEYGQVTFAGSQVLGGYGTVVFGNSHYIDAHNGLLVAGGTTLVIGPGITVHGQIGVIGYYATPSVGSVANQGTISADVSGGTITINAANFDNAGTLAAQNGGVIQPASGETINTGTIVVDTGTMTFANSFTQTAGTLDFGLNSPTDFGQITLSGSATLGGTLAAHLGPNYRIPNIHDSFAVLNYGTNSVSFTNLDLPASAAWQTNLHEGVLTLVVEGILPGPVTISPTNQTVAAGSTVTFAATASGPGPFGYQWRWNGAVLVGATNSSLVLSNVTSAASGAYTVQVSNANGSVLSAAAGLSVLGSPAITMEPQSQTARVGTTVTFLMTVAGTPPLSYQWSFDGQALPGATNVNLTLTNVTRVQAGSYVVVVSNAVGSVTSAPLAVLSIATGVACPGTPPGMVAWWRGEGNTGDYAGTNDAVFEGTAAYGPGEVGQAFLLDGVTSNLQAPNNALWAFGTNDFTVELWANLAQINASLAAGDGSVVFVGHDEGPGAHNKWFFGFGGQELYFFFYGPSVGPQLVAAAPVNLVTNQWYHLAVTKGSNVYRTYLDGSQVGVETNNLAVPLANAPLTIGQAEDLFMDGLLDEISLYNRALGASEIQAIFHAGGQGKCGLESGSAISLQAHVGADGKVTIQITGAQIGATLTVEATGDFKQWVPVGNVVASQEMQSFIDPTPVLPLERYYRVRQTFTP